MSRIRSIHPGLWTDEAFVTLSPFARLLFIGMWNECDDKGTFQWSPLQLKMRLLAADNLDASGLLAEIAAAGFIMRYEVAGKPYGAVKNFAKFQRPKKMNDVHPAPLEVLDYVGLKAELETPNDEPVPDEFPTGSELSPQMEDGGEGEGEGEVAPDGACPPDGARFTVKDFVESWNEIADLCGLPRIAKLTDRRRRAFAIRQREYPEIEDWRRAFRCLRDSRWMHGDNKNGWRADPDFFLQAKSFTKLVEGSYGQAH